MEQSNYPAKKAYQTKNVEKYDNERFTSLKGRFFDKREKSSITILLKKHLPNNITILDLPVGTGRIAEVLLTNGYTVTGADISADMLEISNQKLSRFKDKYNSIIQDAEHLTFSDNTFDTVTSARLFGHLPSNIKTSILREMLRVSKSGCFVTFYYDSFTQKIKRTIKNVIKPNSAPWFPLNLSNIKLLIAEAGGEIKDCKYVLPILSEGITYYVIKKEQ